MTTDSLKAALEPFAKFADEVLNSGDPSISDCTNFISSGDAKITYGDLRRASSANSAALRASTDAAPVAWMYKHPNGGSHVSISRLAYLCKDQWTETPLYAHPPVPDAAGEERFAELSRAINAVIGDLGQADSEGYYNGVAHESDVQHLEQCLAALAQPPAAEPVGKPQDHWTVKALIKAGNALCMMAETSGGVAGADPALKTAIEQWASIRRIVIYEGDGPSIGAGAPDHPLRSTGNGGEGRS